MPNRAICATALPPAQFAQDLAQNLARDLARDEVPPTNSILVRTAMPATVQSRAHRRAASNTHAAAVQPNNDPDPLRVADYAGWLLRRRVSSRLGGDGAVTSELYPTAE